MSEAPLYAVACIAFAPFLLSLLFTFLHIRIMKAKKWGQYIRQYGPKIHEYKTGTPTAGGVPFLVSLMISFFILWYFLPGTRNYIPVIAVGTLSFGIIGLIDDLISLFKEQSKGLGIRYKILFQIGVSGLVFFLFKNMASARKIKIPFASKAFDLNPYLLWLVATLLLVAAVNALNLTDGLDGLAAGTSVITLVAFSFMASNQMLPLLIVAVSASLGFLWYNFYPARLFMGDTGSFALGGLIGTAFLTEGLELYLPLLGAVFVFESLSVMIQVALYKNTGTRLFKVSPLHHHFEHAEELNYDFLLPEVEWAEPLITIRFFIVQAVFAVFGVLIFFGF